jgi:predicted kinase
MAGENERVSLPTLVVVSGPPGSGKTTLAHAIAAAIPCPAICRDEIKEGMVHAHGAGFVAGPGDQLTKRTFPLFFEVVRILVEAGVSVVAEAAFQDRNWRAGLEPMLGRVRLRIVHCTVDEAVARERVGHRLSRGDASRASHADADLLRAGATVFDRISVPAPSIEVDTTDGYAPKLSEVVAFINRS